MLYPLLYPFADQFQFFNLFRYITFRSGGAVVTALLISFLLGPHLILWLRRKQANGQPIRPDGPNGHLLRKKGTPTMGGFLILLALTISTLLWADLTNPYVWIVLLVTVGFGLIGFFDDYRKLTRNSHRGLSGRAKLALEFVLGAARLHRHYLCSAGRAGERSGRAVLQERAVRARLVFCAVWRLCHRRRLERGQPDGRARRAGDRSLDDRGGLLRRSSPISPAIWSSPITCRSITSSAPAS